MDRNVGGLDRGIRLIVGPILLLVAIAAFAGLWSGGTTVVVALLVVGAILTVTGATQTCPLNSFFGIDTTE